MYSTYINLHSFNRECLNLWIFVWHEPIELMSAFVPFDTVEFVATQIVAAGQVGCFAFLKVIGDADRQVGQTFDYCKENIIVTY